MVDLYNTIKRELHVNIGTSFFVYQDQDLSYVALFGAIKADLLAIEIEEDRASKKERKPTLFESKLNDEK